MSVLGRLAGAHGRNDERPNVELAETIAAKGDKAAVAELAGALTAGHHALQNILNDARSETRSPNSSRS